MNENEVANTQMSDIDTTDISVSPSIVSYEQIYAESSDGMDCREGYGVLKQIRDIDYRNGAVLLNANGKKHDFELDDEDLICLSLTAEALNVENTHPGIFMYHSAINTAHIDTALVSVTSIGGTTKGAVNAARVSYGRDNAQPFDEKDAKLLARLFRDSHGTPIEHNHITYRVLVPNPIFKQMLRSRIGVSVNEISGRYSIIKDRFYLPERLRLQNPTNHQGSINQTPDQADALREIAQNGINAVKKSYDLLIEAGVAKEIARFVLPTGFFTEAYITFNMRSLIHFLNLRVDSHAQYEIQEYGKMFAIGAYLAFPEFFQIMLGEESAVFSDEVKQTLVNLIKPLQTLPGDTVDWYNNNYGFGHTYLHDEKNDDGLRNIQKYRHISTNHLRGTDF